MPLPDEHRPGVPQQRADDLRPGPDQRLGVAVEVGDPPAGVDRDERVGHVLSVRATARASAARSSRGPRPSSRQALPSAPGAPGRAPRSSGPTRRGAGRGTRRRTSRRSRSRAAPRLGGRHVLVDERRPEGRDVAVERGRVDAEQVADLLVPQQDVGAHVPVEGADGGRGHDEVERHPTSGPGPPARPARAPAAHRLAHRHPPPRPRPRKSDTLAGMREPAPARRPACAARGPRRRGRPGHGLLHRAARPVGGGAAGRLRHLGAPGSRWTGPSTRATSWPRRRPSASTGRPPA